MPRREREPGAVCARHPRAVPCSLLLGNIGPSHWVWNLSMGYPCRGASLRPASPAMVSPPDLA
eukprot:8064251-Pyramimonas_sp.AAC.1